MVGRNCDTAIRRRCFMIMAGQCDQHGYIPSLITEHEPGHTPLTGAGHPCQQPWYWGKTWGEATTVCAAANSELGLTDIDVADIVASSIAAGSFS